MKKTTLQEHGKRLLSSTLNARGDFTPGGVPFDLRPWNTMVEREAARLRASKKGSVRVGEYVTRLLAFVLTRLGTQGDFQSLAPDVREAHVSNMSLGDILYIWSWLRIEAMGPEVGIQTNCPSCKEPVEMKTSLDSMDLVVYDRPEDTRFEFTFPKGHLKLKAAPDKKFQKVRFAPVAWGAAFANASGGSRVSDYKIEIIKASIEAIDGHDNKSPLFLEDDAIENLTRIDFEEAQAALDELAAAPLMVIECECEHCNCEIVQQIDWTFDSFFSRASLPRKKKSGSKNSRFTPPTGESPQGA